MITIIACFVTAIFVWGIAAIICTGDEGEYMEGYREGYSKGWSDGAVFMADKEF